MTVSAQTRRDLVAAFEDGLDDFAAVATAPAPDLPGLGTRPTPEELAGIEARHQARMLEARQQVYLTARTRDEVASPDYLGVGGNQITNLLRDRKLVALEGPDGQRLPAWQFDLGASSVRLDGIDRVVTAYPGGVVSLSEWMVAPNPTLDGAMPADVLASGDVDAVVAAAESIGA